MRTEDTIELGAIDSWIDSKSERGKSISSDDGCPVDPDSLFLPLQIKPARIGKFVKEHRNIISKLDNYKKWLKPAVVALLAIGYIIYFGFAMSKRYGYYPFPFPNGNYILFVLTIIAVVFILWDVGVPLMNKKFSLNRKIAYACSQHPSFKKHAPMVLGVAIFLAAVIVLLVFIIRSKQLSSLQAIAGFIVILGSLYLTSEHPECVRWRVVGSGLLLQFWLGFFVLQTQFGYDLVSFLADEVEIFLNFSQAGADFVYGSLTVSGAFAINVLSIVIFVSAAVNLFYYLGWMQWLISKIGWLLSTILDSSPAESISSAANIFLGHTEAPLLIKPFMMHMTQSELFALMVGGFASVSGSVLGAFITFGVPAVHLVTACVMVAPGALALSKLFYPETKQTGVSANLIKAYKGDDNNAGAIDAVLRGATTGLKIAGAILCSLIAVLSLLEFLDSIVQWLFSMIRHPEIDFQHLLAYIFFPVAFLIGVSPRDCLVAGRLFGIKTILNEFVAFEKLGYLTRLRDAMIQNGTFAAYDCGLIPWNNTDLMMWEEKSIDVMTYALCGFANISSIGIQMGCLTILAPSRRNFFTSYVVKAMIVGILANVITAACAGLLYDPRGGSYVRNCSMVM